LLCDVSVLGSDEAVSSRRDVFDEELALGVGGGTIGVLRLGVGFVQPDLRRLQRLATIRRENGSLNSAKDVLRLRLCDLGENGHDAENEVKYNEPKPDAHVKAS